VTDRLTQNLEVWSRTMGDGSVELSLEEASVAEPIDDELVIEVRAAPINPYDLRLMIGAADPATAVAVGTRDRPVTRIRIPEVPGRTLQHNAARVGTEGFGRVIRAGSASEARALLGQFVAVWASGTYSRYCKVRASECLPLPTSTEPAAGAGALLNPLTAQAMIETMRAEGYAALLNSAAGSNLGRILRNLCRADGIDLINIVRNEEQARVVRAEGARLVCVSSAPGFFGDLTACLRTVGPTLAFDAVGGGPLAGTLLSAMDAAKAHNSGGPDWRELPFKVYIYGTLDPSPSIIGRGYSRSWYIGGWTLPATLKSIGAQRVAQLRQRIVRDLNTTFAAQYARSVSLSEMISPQVIAACARRSTGAKHLVDPWL